MNILVTGGAGFIGTNLIISLLEKGHKVTSVDNYSTGLKKNHIYNANYIQLDIRHIEDYSYLGSFDIVFHLAAVARIQPSFSIPYDYFSTNASATFRLAQYCSKNNIPLIYAGSSSHWSGKFKNPYTFSKDVGEDIIKLFQLHYNLQATVARFYNVYGPYQLTEGAYCTVIGKWEKRIKEKKPLIIYGDGSKRRDFTHVSDIVNALVLIAEKSKWNYEFELGYGKNYSIMELAQLYKYPYEFQEDKPGEAQETLCTSLLAREELEWIPSISVTDYIKEREKL